MSDYMSQKMDDQITGAQSENERLLDRIAELEAENARLRARIAGGVRVVCCFTESNDMSLSFDEYAALRNFDGQSVLVITDAAAAAGSEK